MKRSTVTLAALATAAFFTVVSPVSAETAPDEPAVFAGEEETIVFNTSGSVIEVEFVGVGAPTAGLRVVPQGTPNWSCEKSRVTSADGDQRPIFSASLRCELNKSVAMSDERAYLPVRAFWPERSIGTEQYLFSGGDAKRISVLSGDDDDSGNGGGSSCWEDSSQPRCWLEPQGGPEVQCIECKPNCWRDSDGTLHCKLEVQGGFETMGDETDEIGCYYDPRTRKWVC